MASSSAAMTPTRSEKNRRPAMPSRTQDAAPSTRLDDAHQSEAVAREREDDGEPVRIQRRLVEDLRPDPVSAGNLLRPRVVLAAVAHQAGQQRASLQLRQVREAHHEGQQRGPGNRQPEASPPGEHARLTARAFLSVRVTRPVVPSSRRTIPRTA